MLRIWTFGGDGVGDCILAMENFEVGKFVGVGIYWTLFIFPEEFVLIHCLSRIVLLYSLIAIVKRYPFCLFSHECFDCFDDRYYVRDTKGHPYYLPLATQKLLTKLNFLTFNITSCVNRVFRNQKLKQGEISKIPQLLGLFAKIPWHDQS